MSTSTRAAKPGECSIPAAKSVTLERRSSEMNYREHIVRDPDICAGHPTFRGTRVLLRVVLAYLADGKGSEEIRASFPSLTDEHVRVAIAFAAASSGEDLPMPEPPPFARDA